MKLKFILMTLISFLVAFNSHACDLRTSQTSLSKYEILNILQTSKLRICIDDETFNRYDIKDFSRKGARLMIDAAGATGLNRYDLKDLAKLGRISLGIHTGLANRFNRYDIKDFLKLNIRIQLKDTQNIFNRYDIKDFLRMGNISVAMRSSETQFNRYDLLDFGEIISTMRTARVLLVIDDDKFNQYDIRDFQEKGIRIKYQN
ncbi:MAG: hypothetical protein CME62_09330 [Halobacteriovoraceae bacterium]|nr:hypothetical protein [Halobacteriovoraceae bacterium]|tara:strand:- start:1395 stop:2003 length:609 start_codon:yes stop_codon:yes gene_type:complete